jgi:signal transduction histidine kinase
MSRLHAEDKDRVLATIQATSTNGERMWSGEYRFLRKNGDYAVVLDRGYIIRGATGKPIRIVGGISDITPRRQAEEALERSRKQLRALSARLQSAREDERTRLAREIHDELGQVLTALKINLDWMEQKLELRASDAVYNPLLERVVESSEMVESAVRTVQKIAVELRPAALDTLGLLTALRQEAQRFQQRTGLRCHLKVPERPPDVSRDVATAAFRIFQESLTNVARHAQATDVTVQLDMTGEHLTLAVEDNGVGLPPHAAEDGESLGLLGMRERAAVLGGKVAIRRGEIRGTRVTLLLPRDATEKQFWMDL